MAESGERKQPTTMANAATITNNVQTIDTIMQQLTINAAGHGHVSSYGSNGNSLDEEVTRSVMTELRPSAIPSQAVRGGAIAERCHMS